MEPPPYQSEGVYSLTAYPEANQMFIIIKTKGLATGLYNFNGTLTVKFILFEE
jgi:hypothetical protein